MKKILLLILILVLLTGCSKKEELTCDISATTVTIIIKNGKIIDYIDKINGKLEQEKINQLNEEYLKNINDNQNAKNKLKDVIAILGGQCNDVK